jgi:hypothetical protein
MTPNTWAPEDVFWVFLPDNVIREGNSRWSGNVGDHPEGDRQ